MPVLSVSRVFDLPRFGGDLDRLAWEKHRAKSQLLEAFLEQLQPDAAVSVLLQEDERPDPNMHGYPSTRYTLKLDVQAVRKIPVEVVYPRFVDAPPEPPTLAGWAKYRWGRVVAWYKFHSGRSSTL